jgi:drug/metabolite transporter (DMT)-like permease
VNPVIAVVVGYFFGGEPLGVRTILGTLFVLTSVVVITSSKGERSTARIPTADPAKAVES